MSASIAVVWFVCPPGTLIHDDENDGIIHIVGDDVTVVFEKGSVLVGRAGPSRVSDTLSVSERDRFAIIAHTEIELPEGRWKLSTRSDDGVRVLVNGKPLIERWDIHAPTRDGVVFEVDGATPTRIVVEYFENDGYATFQLDLHPAE